MRGFAGVLLAVTAILVLRVDAACAAGEATGAFFMPFLGDFRAELQTARQQKRKGMVVVYEMDGCPFCERLKRTSLSSPDVRQYFHANFLVFRIDVKGATDVTGPDGSETTEAEFAARQGVRATPTIVFYDAAGRELTRLVGPTSDAAEFLLLGRYVVDDHYKSTTFTAFRNRMRTGSR